MNKKYSSAVLILFCLMTVKNFAQTNSKIGMQVETAYIMDLTGSGKNIIAEVDFIKMLKGKAADAEAKKRHEGYPSVNKKGDTTWSALNDYFIVNDDKEVKKYALAPNAYITLVTNGVVSLTKRKIADLKATYKGGIYKLTIIKNTITKVEEIFVP